MLLVFPLFLVFIATEDFSYICWPTLFLKPESGCEKNVVFKVLENCVVSFADFEQMLAGKC